VVCRLHLREKLLGTTEYLAETLTMAERSVKQEGDGAATPNITSNMSVLVFEGSNGRSKSVKRPRPVKSCTECRQVIFIRLSSFLMVTSY
jgi:hypothetical protein